MRREGLREGVRGGMRCWKEGVKGGKREMLEILRRMRRKGERVRGRKGNLESWYVKRREREGDKWR